VVGSTHQPLYFMEIYPGTLWMREGLGGPHRRSGQGYLKLCIVQFAPSCFPLSSTQNTNYTNWKLSSFSPVPAVHTGMLIVCYHARCLAQLRNSLCSNNSIILPLFCRRVPRRRTGLPVPHCHQSARVWRFSRNEGSIENDQNVDQLCKNWVRTRT